MQNKTSSKIGLLLFAGMMIAALCAPLKSQTRPTEDNIDWIFIIDTSKSMRGVGAENVFGKVKEQVKQFIHSANEGDTIVIYTFDKGSRLIRNVLIKNSLDRQDLLDGVDEIKAEGGWTQTGDAVQKALDRAKLMRAKQAKDLNREVAMVLFTDDKEDHDPKERSVYLSEVPISKTEFRPFTFVVYLNQNNPPKELLDFVDRMDDRGYFKKLSSPAEIANIRDQIFVQLPPMLRISPTALSFGQIEPGASTSKQALMISTNRVTYLKARLEGVDGASISLNEPSDVIKLEAGDNSIDFRLKAAPDISDASHGGKLVFNVDEIYSRGQEKPKGSDKQSTILYTVDFSLRVARIPFYQKLMLWSAILLGATALAWGTSYMILGKHPTEAWRDHFHLEGEIIIIEPRALGTNNSISLRNENSSKINLSQLQGGILKEYLRQADAELKTIHKDDEKFVRIIQKEGNLYVQGQSVASEDLYDGDTIKVDDISLRFRGSQERAAAN